MPMLTKSVRLPQEIVDDVRALSPETNFTEVILQALQRWIAEKRRQAEDAMIARALSGVSAQQREEETELAATASKSSRRVMEQLHG